MHILDTKLLFFVVPLFTSFVFGDGLKIDVACDSNRVSFLFENQSDKVLCVHTPSTIDVSYDDFTSSVYFIPDCKSETYERTSPYSVTCIPSKDKKNIEINNEIYLDLFKTMSLDDVKGFYFLEGNEADFSRLRSREHLYTKKDCLVLNDMFLKKKEKTYVKKPKCK